jgi:tetratricopeptide (TPR) repeat protein
MTSPDPLANRRAANPESDFSQPTAAAEVAVALTNQGWAALEQGEPQQAVQHFRRALRLRPNYSRARSGIVEALKAHHPLYRQLLSWFFWLSRFQPATQIGVMLAAFLAIRLIMVVGGESVWPLSLAFLGVCVLLGLASPLFDVLLRIDPDGGQSLDADQRRGANLLLFNLLAPLPLILWFSLTNNGLGIVTWILFTLTSLPSSAIYRCRAGWPRWTMIVITTAVLAMITPLLVGALLEVPGWTSNERLKWIEYSFYSLIGAQLVATMLLTLRGRH